MVLLVIDAQNAITNSKLHNFKGFVSSVEQLIASARRNHIEVIYVRHDDGPGSELARGTWGYEIYDKFAPLEGDKIVDKQFNSAFKGTDLLAYLKQKNEQELMIVGLQTDHCIDATIKSGFEHGFRIIVPAGANTTVDNDFLSASQTVKYYNDFMWNGRYAIVDKFTVHASITAMPFFEKRGYKVIREQHVERSGVILANYVCEIQKVRNAAPSSDLESDKNENHQCI